MILCDAGAESMACRTSSSCAATAQQQNAACVSAMPHSQCANGWVRSGGGSDGSGGVTGPPCVGEDDVGLRHVGVCLGRGVCVRYAVDNLRPRPPFESFVLDRSWPHRAAAEVNAEVDAEPA